MPTDLIRTTTQPWCVLHALAPEDQPAMEALRAAVAPHKGKMQGPAARAAFDGIMLRVAPPEGVSYREDRVGGVPGWWCLPDNAEPGATILHLHGGWFNWGTAEAFRHLVGHIARSASPAAFVPSYRLAPEHPFPAPLDDAEACYVALAADGGRRIVLTGDSAGGNLALVLLARTVAMGTPPRGAAVLSPVTDLAMTGSSWETRAAADPYFTRPQVAGLIAAYAGVADPTDARLSPLYGDLVGLPPIQVTVGRDEVLLDDSRRYVERAVVAGVSATLDIWEGMPHGFLSGIGRLTAARETLTGIGRFLSARLAE